MAASGNKSVTVTSWDTLKFSWWFNSGDQSTANNTTLVRWKLELIAGSSGAISSSAAKDWSVTVNGAKYSGTNTIGIGNNAAKTLASGVTTVSHAADGTKTFSYSFSQEFEITFSGTKIGTISGSGSGVLNTIPRASQPSCITYPNHTQNVGNFGSTISIHMNRNVSSFTHTVRYKFGTKSGTIAREVTTGTTWTIPLTLMDLIPAATSGSGTIYVDTYSGSTLIGTKSCGFTATVPASVKPSCSLALTDTTGIDKIYGSPVKGLSKISITVTPTLAYSSPIASYAVTANGVRYTTASPTTGLLATSGKSAVSATVTDKRGRAGTASYEMTVLDYAAPVVSAVTAKRCDANGTENKRGEYVKVTFSASISAMNGKNNALYYLKYKKSSETSYTKVPLTAMTNVYSVSGYTYIFAANKGNSYDILLEAVDRHNSAHPATKGAKAPTAFAIMSWRGFKTSNGVEDGLGIGKVPDRPNVMQVGWDSEFDRNVALKGSSYSFQAEGFNGAKGYTLLAVITLTTLNVNAPIVFVINRRGAVRPMNVYARFASSSTTTDPDLASFTYEGDNYGVFMVKESTSRWKLYVDNTDGWSNPCLQDWFTTQNQTTRMTVEFMSEQVAGTSPSVLGTYYRATPVVSKSILDAFYPVGYILFLYSHADPNEMYPGTTWVRIENSLLWATTPGGVIGSVSAKAAKTTSDGYAFTQVSVWRRTA